MKLSNILIVGGIAGLAIYLYSKVSGYKMLASNIQATPKWDGGINNMHIDTSNITIPLAVEFNNRAQAGANLTLNAIDCYYGGKQVAFSQAGYYNVYIAPQSVSTMRGIRMNFPLITAAQILGTSIANIVANPSAWQDELMRILNDLTFRIDVIVDGVNVSLKVDMSGSIRLDGGLGLKLNQQRDLLPKSDYEALIAPKSVLDYTDEIIISDVAPEQTAKFLRKVAKQYKNDVRILSRTLVGNDLRTTVQNVWDFVAFHIRYVEDSEMNEQVRRPLRTLHDQQGDCDCMSALIAAIFESLNIPYVLRIAEYNNKGYYQHVYVVVKSPYGELPCDTVYDRCFAEKPYTHKRDF